MRFHQLDINLLVVLHHLLQGKTVKETAQLLNLSQPAVSNALSRLRHHFEEPLFATVGRRLEPTPFARTLTVPVSNALEEIERIICSRSDFVPETAERTFTIVCSDYVHEVFITNLLRQLSEIAPNVGLLVLLISETTSSLFDDGKIDFLIAPTPLTFPSHPKASLFNETYSCIAWTGNDSIRERLTRQIYFKSKHVGVTLGLNAPKRFSPPAEQEALEQPPTFIYAPTFGAVANSVVGTCYLATVHTRLAKLFAERLPLRVLDVPVPTDRFTECLQWHRNKDNDAGTIWLRELMVGMAANF